MLTDKAVTFWDKPANNEEKEIYNSIFNFINGVRLKDKKILNEVISEDARIESLLAGCVIGKKEYIERISGARLFNARFFDVLIQKKLSDVVVCSGILETGDITIEPKQHSIYLKRINSCWHVIKTEYAEKPKWFNYDV